MLKTLALLGVIILALVAVYNNKKKAQCQCSTFADRINNDKEFAQLMNAITSHQSLLSFHELKQSSRWYLIEKCDSKINVHSLNNNRKQTMVESQYTKLMVKLSQNNPTYTYSLESYSIFYSFPNPNGDSILRIDY